MGIKFDSKKIQIVDTWSIHPNSWNPKDKDTKDYKKIKKGIEIKGQRLPIVVRENEGLEIIDGEQRWRACCELGFVNVVVYNEGKIPDKEAKELTIWYQQQVPFNELELASLVSDITKYDGYELPYSEEEIKNYVDLTKFDWDNYKNNIDEKNDDKSTTFVLKFSIEQYEIVIEGISKMREKYNLTSNEECFTKMSEIVRR